MLDASTGEEALQRAQQFAGPIHLLLSDVVMPHMSGPTLAAQLQAQYPTLKVLFISGYPESELVHRYGAVVARALLSKPFTPDTLVRKVREILDMPL
ncbi:response regulator [Candidatus Parcubacteria bacterium]|nr:MAG: response regulator [Candidatus Parcubacteria bacterium]